MNKETKFKVGDKAHKPKGYKFPCTIVGVFETIAGEVRVIGEMDEYGLLHIFNENQLEHYGKDEPDLLNDAYMSYCLSYKDGHEFYEDETVKRSYTQQEFINKCKTDIEFSEKWGLKIEERELSLEERLLLADKINKEIRQDLYTYAFNNPIYTGGIDQRPDDVERHNLLSDLNIPTKLITIKYNDKKIESYE